MAQNIIRFPDSPYTKNIGDTFVVSPVDEYNLSLVASNFTLLTWEKYDPISKQWQNFGGINSISEYISITDIASGGEYRVRYQYSNDVEKVATFTVNVNPGIPKFTKQPSDTEINQYGIVPLTFGYENFKELSAQYLKNGNWEALGLVNFGNIADADGMIDVGDTLRDSGYWRLVAKGLNDTIIISDNFYVKYNPDIGVPAFPSTKTPIIIQSQPSAPGVYRGEAVTFSITADNVDIYQWEFLLGGVWVNAGLENSSTPTLTTAMDSEHIGTYRCVLINALETVISQEFTLDIMGEELSIYNQPTNLDISEGETINVSVSATGADHYDWQKKSGSNWVSLGWEDSGYVTSVNPATATDSGTYRCVLTNAFKTVISDEFTITVAPGPDAIFDSQPNDEIVFEGDTLQFSISATNAVTYEIQKESNGNWVSVIRDSNNYLTITENATSRDVGKYRFAIYNAGGKATYSNEFTVTVNKVLPPSLETVVLDSYGIHPTDDTGKNWAFSNMQRVQHYQTIRIVPRWNLNGTHGGDVSVYPLVKSFTATEIGNSGILKEIKTDWGNLEVSLLVVPVPSNTAGAQLAIHFETVDGKSFDRTVTFNFA